MCRNCTPSLPRVSCRGAPTLGTPTTPAPLNNVTDGQMLEIKSQRRRHRQRDWPGAWPSPSGLHCLQLRRSRSLQSRNPAAWHRPWQQVLHTRT